MSLGPVAIIRLTMASGTSRSWANRTICTVIACDSAVSCSSLRTALWTPALVPAPADGRGEVASSRKHAEAPLSPVGISTVIRRATIRRAISLVLRTRPPTLEIDRRTSRSGGHRRKSRRRAASLSTSSPARPAGSGRKDPTAPRRQAPEPRQRAEAPGSRAPPGDGGGRRRRSARPGRRRARSGRGAPEGDRARARRRPRAGRCAPPGAPPPRGANRVPPLADRRRQDADPGHGDDPAPPDLLEGGAGLV